METVIEALGAMGKASAREVAARMAIEPVDALAMLREHEELDRVYLLNGYWQIVDKSHTAGGEGGVVEAVPVEIQPKPVETGMKCSPERLTPDMEFKRVEALLQEHGQMKTAGMARVFKRDSRGMNSTMRMLERQGKVLKNGDGFWSLPTADDVQPEPEPVAIADTEQKKAPATESCETEKFLETIPVLRKPPEFFQVPSLKEISREIRKTKTNLNRLEKLRAAVREVARHKRTILQFQN